ncbi:MAG: hypothetical protein PVG65_05205 [Candidatus Thorarchaeota archaeon]|jgi:hypothetical protein
MNESLFEIECYNENEFKTKHKKIYNNVKNIADKLGIDLSKYEFGQYIQSKDKSYGVDDDIIYNSLYSEDITFNVQFLNGKLERAEITID